ncbi:MAG: nucleotidyltransferase domain-containing protein [Anaerolineae bacterium]
MSDVDWEIIERVMAGEEAVMAAWVFGSAQTGRLRPGGDLDIGVLFAERPALEVLTRLRMDLQAALQVDDIDLAPLNEASPILRFEAISGRAVFCRDAGRRAIFASMTAREYEDEMAMVQRALSW